MKAFGVSLGTVFLVIVVAGLTMAFGSKVPLLNKIPAQ